MNAYETQMVAALTQLHNIPGESAIVWLEDVDALPYLREEVQVMSSRTRKPRFDGHPGRLVGYTVLAKDAPHHQRPGQGFLRRLFWVRERVNADPYDDSYVPAEGIAPAEIMLGVTKRCA